MLDCTSTCSLNVSGYQACGNDECEWSFSEDEASCPADCVEGEYADGTDNDSDTMTDCADPDCADIACFDSINSAIGIYRTGQCCTGCWDGSRCRPGDQVVACLKGDVSSATCAGPMLCSAQGACNQPTPPAAAVPLDGG